METLKTEQYFLTVSAGKRLIAKAVAQKLREDMKERTVVILGGTTNGYLAEEMLAGKGVDFSKSAFFRGATFAPGSAAGHTQGQYPGDIVFDKGKPVTGKNIFDVAPNLGAGDIIIKGANAVNIEKRQAGILIGNPAAGTSLPIIEAVIGRRARLIIPVGLEKRVSCDIPAMAAKLNAARTSGLRMMPVSGEIVTELDAVMILTGAQAELFAAGGVLGAEGGCWIAVTGNDKQLETAGLLLRGLICEPAFTA